MVYYADNEVSNSIVRVGWLDKTVPFSTGSVNDIFLQKLLRRCFQRTNQTRGYHICPFCAKPEVGVPLKIEGMQVKLGSAEIHVRGPLGHVFVAPDLICHYILAHRYIPPKEFIEAVCSME